MGKAETRSAAPHAGCKRVRWTRAMKDGFLNHLAATCNIMASARAIGVHAGSVYALRRKDEVFAAGWRVAVAQAYEIMETHLLALALSGENAIDTGIGGPDAIIDRDMAMRLLSRQRSTDPAVPRRSGARRKLLTNEEIEAALLAKLARLVPPAGEPA